jgi:RNA polymerase sigma-70 factor (ECF subfamily)
MMRSDDERAFVRRMLAGDEATFDEFADAYIPALYRFASSRLGGDRELAGDIVQTTLCKAIAKLSTFRGDSALMTWLCACCRNEIAGHFRKKMRPVREVGIEAVEEVATSERGPAIQEAPDSAVLRSEAKQLVHDVLDELPPHYSRVLEWKYLEGLPVREIAVRLEVGPKAAESLLTRAREAFRKTHRRLTSHDGSTVGASRVQPRRMEPAL